VQYENVVQVQKNERRPLNNLKKEYYALWMFIFILSFEFEYRTTVLSRGILIVS
jgi:hypothetical protein